jgi:hypothetical protein
MIYISGAGEVPSLSGWISPQNRVSWTGSNAYGDDDASCYERVADDSQRKPGDKDWFEEIESLCILAKFEELFRMRRW